MVNAKLILDPRKGAGRVIQNSAWEGDVVSVSHAEFQNGQRVTLIRDTLSVPNGSHSFMPRHPSTLALAIHG